MNFATRSFIKTLKQHVTSMRVGKHGLTVAQATGITDSKV